MAKSLHVKAVEIIREICPSRNNQEIGAAMKIAHEEMQDAYINRVIDILGAENKDIDKARRMVKDCIKNIVGMKIIRKNVMIMFNFLRKCGHDWEPAENRLLPGQKETVNEAMSNSEFMADESNYRYFDVYNLNVNSDDKVCLWCRF